MTFIVENKETCHSRDKRGQKDFENEYLIASHEGPDLILSKAGFK